MERCVKFAACWAADSLRAVSDQRVARENKLVRAGHVVVESWSRGKQVTESGSRDSFWLPQLTRVVTGREGMWLTVSDCDCYNQFVVWTYIYFSTWNKIYRSIV